MAPSILNLNLVALLLLSLMVMFAVAENPPHHRDITVSVQKQKLKFQAGYTDPTYRDSFEFRMDLAQVDNQVLRGYFSYQSQSPNKTQLQFDFAVERLLEINTTLADYYRGDNSTIISHWPSGSKGVEFSNWIDESMKLNGTRVHRFSATSTDLVFMIRVSIADVAVRLAGVPIGPNDVKIDLVVNKFLYTLNSSRIVLQTHINSITESVNSPSQWVHSDNLVFSGHPGYPSGSFSWVNRANITTEEIGVMAWSPQTRADTHFDIFYTFETPKKEKHPVLLIWDPRIGLDYRKGEHFCIGSVCGIGAIFIIIGIVIGALLLVGLITMVIVSRRRGYESIHDNPPPTYVS